LKWVYNILDGKAEQERVLLDDPEFVVLPDLRWDGKAIESMYVQAIVKEKNIKSLREIKHKHIELLQRILEKTKAVILSKCGIPSSSIRAFFHYPPSFYHLHVHFTTLENSRCGSETERAHLIEDVIDNLKLMPDYYEKKTLHYKVDVTNQLYNLLQKQTIE